MDDALRVVVELNQRVWSLLKTSLDDLQDDEIDWRPLPESNSINVIVRHLRIEAQWHLDSLTQGTRMPSDEAPPVQADIDAVPVDFARNLGMLDELFAAFLDALRATTPDGLRQRTAAAYGSATEGRAHFLGYHQALHVAAHGGQIRMIRNLYRKTRGEPARFFPENPTYPR